MVTFALCTLLAFTAAAPQQQGQQQNGLFNCLTQVGCEREDYIGIWTAKLADTTVKTTCKTLVYSFGLLDEWIYIGTNQAI